MQVHLKALGCRLNEAELEEWAGEFQNRGHSITRDPSAADLLVINTCAVTREAVRKSRQMIRRAHRTNPHAKVVVSGCFASLEPEALAASQSVDLIVHNRDKDRLVEIASEALDLHAMPALATSPGETAVFSRRRSRAFIKVQDGCRYRCAFCIVTTARGEERSKSIAGIVSQINRLVARGFKEAVLTGVHLGGYGSDIDNDLRQLIHAILSDTDLPRLRLGSLEPWDLPDKFFSLFRDPRLMPHLHLPLQSGCDAVLRRMARRCKTKEFEDLVSQARADVTDFNVSTDIIIGFPGETETEFQHGLEFLERIGFSHIHIFPYSPRDGTRAARMPDQVSLAVKRQRSKELHALSRILKRDTLSRFLGCKFPVLLERKGTQVGEDSVCYQGYTPNYLRVRCQAPAGRSLDNEIKSTRMIAVAEDGESMSTKLV